MLEGTRWRTLCEATWCRECLKCWTVQGVRHSGRKQNHVSGPRLSLSLMKSLFSECAWYFGFTHWFQLFVLKLCDVRFSFLLNSVWQRGSLEIGSWRLLFCWFRCINVTIVWTQSPCCLFSLTLCTPVRFSVFRFHLHDSLWQWVLRSTHLCG